MDAKPVELPADQEETEHVIWAQAVGDAAFFRWAVVEAVHKSRVCLLVRIIGQWHIFPTGRVVRIETGNAVHKHLDKNHLKDSGENSWGHVEQSGPSAADNLSVRYGGGKLVLLQRSIQAGRMKTLLLVLKTAKVQAERNRQRGLHEDNVGMSNLDRGGHVLLHLAESPHLVVRHFANQEKAIPGLPINDLVDNLTRYK